MALTINFNASTGTDTQASGSAAPATAIFGTNASFSGSTVTLDGSPDLSAFDAATWVLWMQTSTGRQYFDLSAADDVAKTVTCVNAPAGTSTGRTWAIGGKRATLDAATSRTVFVDAKAGWYITTETDQTLTSEITASSSGGTATLPVTVSSNNTTRRVLNTTANAAVFNISAGAAWRFKYLQFTCSNATRTSARGVRTTLNPDVSFQGCLFGHATNTLLNGFYRDGGGTSWASFVDCGFISCTGKGIDYATAVHLSVAGCTFKDCVGGLACLGNLTVTNSLFYDLTATAIDSDSNTIGILTTIIGNTIDGNTGATTDGIQLSKTSLTVILGNQITNNGRYGINAPTGADAGLHCDWNNYFGNSSGNNNVTAGPNDTTNDPQYTDADNEDFSVGTNAKEAGFPDSGATLGAGQSSTTTYVDQGAAQREEPAGGGGGLLVHPGMSGGLRG